MVRQISGFATPFPFLASRTPRKAYTVKNLTENERHGKKRRTPYARRNRGFGIPSYLKNPALAREKTVPGVHARRNHRRHRDTLGARDYRVRLALGIPVVRDGCQRRGERQIGPDRDFRGIFDFRKIAEGIRQTRSGIRHILIFRRRFRRHSVHPRSRSVLNARNELFGRKPGLRKTQTRSGEIQSCGHAPGGVVSYLATNACRRIESGIRTRRRRGR